MKLRKITPATKKGSIGDVLFFIVTIFAIVLFLLFVSYIVPQITNTLRTSEINESSGSRTALDKADEMAGSLDTIFLTIFSILLMGVLISSFMIEAHPIFIPIYIIMLIMAIVVGAILNNIHEEFIANSELAATAADQTFANRIMDNYVLIIIVVSLLSMILIFGKPRLGGGSDRL